MTSRGKGRRSFDPFRIANLGGPGGTGPAAAIPAGLREGMAAFRHRDFRVFFWGALASNSGNWLQNLAVPYVLFELTGRSLWVGLAGFAQFLPSFLLGPLGGALADRCDRRRVLLASQGAMAAAALLLWGVWVVGWRDPWLVLAITALTGVFSGIMIPSWQAFVPALVPRVDLPSAITLNSTQFNASRAVGPALAGLLLAVAGPGWAFLINAVSFLAVIAALVAIRPATEAAPEARGSLGVIAGFREALAYMARRRGILVSVLCAVLVASLGNPVTQFTVVFAADVYESGPTVLGLLAASIGLGAIAAAPLLSMWSTRAPRAQVVRWGLPIYGMAVLGFGLARHWALGLVALLLSGAGFLAVISTTNTSVQMIVAEEMRGRVMSARVMAFTLSFPLGSLLQGLIADEVGPQWTVSGAGVMLLLAAAFLLRRPDLLDALDAEDDTPDRH